MANWKGDNASYTARHSRVYRARGRANTHGCVRCAEVGNTTPAHDWAMMHGTDGLDVEADWMPLCRRCHQAYDGITDAATRQFQSSEHREQSRQRWADPEYKARFQGTNNTQAVLTDEVVRVGRQRHALGESVAALAREFNVASRTLHSAVSGKTWKHVN